MFVFVFFMDPIDLFFSFLGTETKINSEWDILHFRNELVSALPGPTL